MFTPARVDLEQDFTKPIYLGTSGTTDLSTDTSSRLMTSRSIDVDGTVMDRSLLSLYYEAAQELNTQPGKPEYLISEHPDQVYLNGSDLPDSHVRILISGSVQELSPFYKEVKRIRETAENPGFTIKAIVSRELSIDEVIPDSSTRATTIEPEQMNPWMLSDDIGTSNNFKQFAQTIAMRSAGVVPALCTDELDDYLTIPEAVEIATIEDRTTVLVERSEHNDQLTHTEPEHLPAQRNVQSITPRYRRVGLRMSCTEDEVAWTGAADSLCWFCEKPGIPGPPPSIYPDCD